MGSHVAAGAARCEAVFNVEPSSIRFALYKTGAALGGVDSLVFAGRISEHATLVRAPICDGLAFPGIELHASPNAEAAGVSSTDASRTTVRIIRSDEDLMIARSVLRVGQQR